MTGEIIQVGGVGIIPTGDAAAYAARLELAIKGWLAEKWGRSRSERTLASYTKLLASYRQLLANYTRDLDSLPPSTDDLDPRTELARKWARDGEPSGATVNWRLAALSSFFDYAIKNRLVAGSNPIAVISRDRVKPYRGAVPLPRTFIAQKMKEIDRSTVAGARDFAIIQIYLATAQRLQAVADLTWGDVQQVGDKWVLTFKRIKGGDSLTVSLDKRVGAALLDYLHKLHGSNFGQLDKVQPLWVSLQSRNGTAGHKLTPQAISGIMLKRLGTTKVHTLRHSAAANLLDRGANLVEIQRKLGHQNAATTSIYLSRISVEEDRWAEQQAADFGAGD